METGEKSNLKPRPAVKKLSIFYGVIASAVIPLLLGFVVVGPILYLIGSVTGLTFETMTDSWPVMWFASVVSLLSIALASYFTAWHAGYAPNEHALGVGVVTALLSLPILFTDVRDIIKDVATLETWANIIEYMGYIPFALLGGYFAAKNFGDRTNAQGEQNQNKEPNFVTRLYDPRAAGIGIAQNTISTTERIVHASVFLLVMLLFVNEYFMGFKDIIFPKQWHFVSYVVLDCAFLVLMIALPFLMKVNRAVFTKKYWSDLTLINTPAFLVSIVFVIVSGLLVLFLRGELTTEPEEMVFTFDTLHVLVTFLGYALYLHLAYLGWWTARHNKQEKN